MQNTVGRKQKSPSAVSFERLPSAYSALPTPARYARGMSLIEVMFAIAIILMVFMAIYGVFKVSIDVVSDSKARAGALALATERMEQLRALPYDSIGTVGGIPSGTIVQSEAVTINQRDYVRRTFISYVDDPADGTGASDENGVTADYKLVKIELVWNVREVNRTYSEVSTIVPKGIESLVGGGTLRIQVFDALAQPLSGATVRIVNTTGTSTIDVTTYTNAQGFVTFPGTPAGTEYQITVSKSGYSTAQTYAATAGNPNPTPGHLSVANSQTTSASFFIDRLSALTVQTWKPIEEALWEDEFDNTSLLVSQASTTVVSGGLSLEQNGADYWGAGSAMATSALPTYLALWKSASWTATVPANTTLIVQVYYNNAGTPTLVPDAALPGNSAGFATSPIDLTGVSTSTYPSLALSAQMTSSDTSVTPDLRRWGITYDRGPVPIPNVPFTLQGTKTIGTTGAGAAIYKFEQDLTSGSSGAYATSTMEWDTYPLTLGASYDIAEVCAPLPVSLIPNSSQVLNLYLVADTDHSLLVSVKDSVTGNLLSGVVVQLTRSGVDTTATTGTCGQAYFGNIGSGTVAAGTDYAVTISKTGYQSATVNDIEVSGDTNATLTLTPQ